MRFRTFSTFFLVPFCTVIGLQGCIHSKTDAYSAMPTPADHQMMEELDELDDPSEIIKRVLPPFTCTHEKSQLPRLDPDADQLFQHALWLETKYGRDARKASGEPNHVEYQKAVWLYRLAAASGHWGASRRLAEMLENSKEDGSSYNTFAQRHYGSLTLEEIVDTTSAEIAKDLTRRGIPYGYYLKGILLDKEYGKQGVALWYLRRAADMGSPDAQYGFFESLKRLLDRDGDGSLKFYVLTSLLDKDDRDKWLGANPEAAEITERAEIARQMVSCAADQGHGEAANALGKALQGAAQFSLGNKQKDKAVERFSEAVKYFQIAVKVGKMEAAKSLSEGFSSVLPNLKDAETLLGAYRASPSPANWEIREFLSTFLNLPQDKERSKRYEKVMTILSSNHHLEPTVDELDMILPLPPGKLPEWDGEIDWIKRWVKNEAPPLPSEQRIAKIARAKGMEPTFEPKLSTGQLLHLPFTCTYEKDRLPPQDPEADMLYRHANWLYRKGSSDPSRSECNPTVERLYRIAGAWGHKEALQYFVTELGYAHSDGDVPLSLYLIDVAEKLVQRDIPYGYFLMGKALIGGEDEAWQQKRQEQATSCDQGDDECKNRIGNEKRAAYQIRVDEALWYFRKAADLGNPEAQYRLQEELMGHPEMLRCAAKQGHAEAVPDYAKAEIADVEEEPSYMEASDVLEKLNSAKKAQTAGDKAKANEDFAIVMKYLQVTSRAGNLGAISRMLEGFIDSSSGGNKSDRSLFEGEEGERRLFMILSRLDSSSQPIITIGEIDRILRLPSAELPTWGSILAAKEAEETSPPPLPSEERIKEMARAKGLAPETGLPVETAATKCSTQ
jgi:TPR repeat protein